MSAFATPTATRPLPGLTSCCCKLQTGSTAWIAAGHHTERNTDGGRTAEVGAEVLEGRHVSSLQVPIPGAPRRRSRPVPAHGGRQDQPGSTRRKGCSAGDRKQEIAGKFCPDRHVNNQSAAACAKTTSRRMSYVVCRMSVTPTMFLCWGLVAQDSREALFGKLPQPPTVVLSPDVVFGTNQARALRDTLITVRFGCVLHARSAHARRRCHRLPSMLAVCACLLSACRLVGLSGA